MPIYEYGCLSCRQKSSILSRSYNLPSDPTCQHCGGTDVAKLVSSFAVVRSEEDLMRGHDSMDWLYDLDPDDADGLKKIKEWSTKQGVDTGGPFGPENVQQDDLGVPGFGNGMMGPMPQDSMLGGFSNEHADFHGLE